MSSRALSSVRNHQIAIFSATLELLYVLLRASLDGPPVHQLSDQDMSGVYIQNPPLDEARIDLQWLAFRVCISRFWVSACYAILDEPFAFWLFPIWVPPKSLTMVDKGKIAKTHHYSRFFLLTFFPAWSTTSLANDCDGQTLDGPLAITKQAETPKSVRKTRIMIFRAQSMSKHESERLHGDQGCLFDWAFS